MRLNTCHMKPPGSSGLGVMRFIPDLLCCFLLCACLLQCLGKVAFAADAASQQFGKWLKLPAPSKGGESLTLSLKAEKEVKGWMKSHVPVLIIQCIQGKADIYIETGMALEVTAVDQQVVRVRFDGNKPIAQRWREVTNATISARDAATLIKQLAESQQFFVEFTPFNSRPAQAEFAVAGLSAYMPQLAGACWKK